MDGVGGSSVDDTEGSSSKGLATSRTSAQQRCHLIQCARPGDWENYRITENNKENRLAQISRQNLEKKVAEAVAPLLKTKSTENLTKAVCLVFAAANDNHTKVRKLALQLQRYFGSSLREEVDAPHRSMGTQEFLRWLLVDYDIDRMRQSWLVPLEDFHAAKAGNCKGKGNATSDSSSTFRQ
jgi:hypothetical protein